MMEDIEYLLLKYLEGFDQPATVDKFPLYAISNAAVGIKEFNLESMLQRLMEKEFIVASNGRRYFEITAKGRDALKAEKNRKDQKEILAFTSSRKSRTIDKAYRLVFIFSFIALLMALAMVIYKNVVK